MIDWPESYGDSWTLAQPVVRMGIGLHSGQTTTVTLRPWDQPGFFIRLDDAPGSIPIRLEPSQVRDSQLCTTLDFGARRVATVEHLLAALAGCGLSHVAIELSGDEVPFARWLGPGLGGGNR